MHFWDWKTGYNFQRSQASVQPGSLDSEAGIFAMTFDQSSSRLITCEADKTVKIYKEDDTAVSISRLWAETGMSPRAANFTGWKRAYHQFFLCYIPAEKFLTPTLFAKFESH